MKNIKIFLSSRFLEFKELREKVIKEKFSKLDVGLELNALDDRGGIADTRSPALASIEEAGDSDIFILLLGETYGDISDGYDKSYTHLEYEMALKKGLKILAFPIGDVYVNNEYSEQPMFHKWQKDVLVNSSHITATPQPSNYDIDELYESIYASLKEYLNRVLNNELHKKNSPLTSKLGKSTIIGREKELKEIDEKLNSSNALLLINGIGGVGKSTIASYYLHSQKEKLNYYGFFEGLESFVSELRSRLNIKAEKSQEAFMEALAKLGSLEGKKLLVLDDVKDIEENQEQIDKILALKHCGYQILLTSREEIEEVDSYHLDVLSLDDAKALFNSIYRVEDEKLLEELLGYLDYHAFFIEKTAHSIKKNLTPQMLRDKFKNREFAQISVKRKQNFNKFLNQLFSLDSLDDEEILMLKQLSALPSIEINLESLEYIFQKKEDIEFEELLDYLCEKGWLSKLEGGYKFHQIIKEYILSNHTPLFEEIEVVVDSLSRVIGNSEDIQVAVNNRDNIVYFESLANLLERLESENEKVGTFFLDFGNIYRFLGDYEKAEPLYLKALKISEKILGEEHPDRATSYNNLALLYN
jgi:transcriptional regulator of NAD metabolism